MSKIKLIRRRERDMQKRKADNMMMGSKRMPKGGRIRVK
jgi:hypothetical protein